MSSSNEALRGFGPSGLTATLLILAGSLFGPLVSAPLTLLWMWLSRTPPADLGFARPRSWPLTILAGITAGIALKLLMKAVVMPLFGAPPINASFHYLSGNPAALPGILAAVVFGAGFAEELFFRGWLFERLGTLWGRSKAALSATVLVTSALFAAAHYQGQGLPGVQQAAVMGLAYGALYAWRRQIWIVMIVHAVFDITAVVLIYRDWETPVSRWLFG